MSAFPISCVATFVLSKADKYAVQDIMDCASRHFTASDVEFLAKDKAIDFSLMATDHNALQHQLTAALDLAVDICVQPIKNRRKSLLICDMDSTLIGQECIDELADFAGVKDRVSTITERAMRGEIDFDDALKERVNLLKGLDISILEQCFNERIHLNPGARTLCQTMKASGAKTAIVSGGFTYFTGQVKTACGFDSDQANILAQDNGKLTGEVGLPILGRDAKKQALLALTHNVPSNAVALGDGANDLAMIQAAGLGIAYYAKPAVTAAAHCTIQHTDLTTALYYQGFSESEFFGLD